jgi:TorA maturation chaperone TorD
MEQGKETDQALARAVVCRALSLAFQAPSDNTWGQVFSTEGKQALARAASFLDREESGEFRSAARFFATAEEISLADAASIYGRLFGHTVRGRVCPYEMEYGDEGRFLKSQELADISGYFLAFGLEPTGEIRERFDHIAVEWEYLEFLSLKEMVALNLRDDEMLETTRNAYRSFLRDHLSRFGRAFGRSLCREDPGGSYGALGKLCESFVARECRRLGLPQGPEFLALRPEGPDDVPMACGSDDSEELVQID